MMSPDLFVLLLWFSTIAKVVAPMAVGAAGVLIVLVLLVTIMCPLARDDVPPPIDNWRKKQTQGIDGDSEK